MAKKFGKFLLFAAAAGAVAGAAYYYIKKKEEKELESIVFDDDDDVFTIDSDEAECTCRNYVPLNTDNVSGEEFPPVEETESEQETPAEPEAVEEFFDAEKQ